MAEEAVNIVIGIGNEFRGDDAVGLYVARELAKLKPASYIVKESPGEGTYLMDSWENADHVIIVDAVVSCSEAGRIHRIDTSCTEIPRDWFQCSSHLFSLPEAIKLSATLDRLPRSLIIYGIEGNLFDTGVNLSEKVKEAGDKVIALIQTELEELNKKAVRENS